MQTNNLQQHLQKHFKFDEDTLRINRTGKLTSSQIIRQGLGTFSWGGFQVFLGILFAYIGYVAHQSEASFMFILLAIIFGCAFIIRGSQRIFALVNDLRTGVQKIEGDLSVSMQRKAKSSALGITSLSTRYYLHVRLHHSDDDSVIIFPISYSLYQILLPHCKDSFYAVYYLSAVKEILSLGKCEETSFGGFNNS